ncbi:MAG: DUF5615 family PIN-like protein [Candidatus Competibacteraceae bacterium]|nr:DUF5615 family PIN-like protein [Candidatus Competibacteraceae bacterium]
MRILVDMNLTPRWVEVLSAAGFEAVHWSSVGAAGASDHSIATYARHHDLCVLTHDLDFGTILAVTNWSKPSVIQLRSSDVSPTVIGAIVVDALMQARQQIEAGALLTIEPGKQRLRILPFKRG